MQVDTRSRGNSKNSELFCFILIFFFSLVHCYLLKRFVACSSHIHSFLRFCSVGKKSSLDATPFELKPHIHNTYHHIIRANVTLNKIWKVNERMKFSEFRMPQGWITSLYKNDIFVSCFVWIYSMRNVKDYGIIGRFQLTSVVSRVIWASFMSCHVVFIFKFQIFPIFRLDYSELGGASYDSDYSSIEVSAGMKRKLTHEKFLRDIETFEMKKVIRETMIVKFDNSF